MKVPLQTSLSPEYEMDFLQSLKRELHITSDEKIINTIYLVLKVVRNSLNQSQIAAVTKAFPSLLQLIFLGSWRQNETRTPIRHLDELVELVYQEDKTQTERLFSTEVEALRSTLIVIKYLKLAFDKIGISVFTYSVVLEYQQAIQRDAV